MVFGKHGVCWVAGVAVFEDDVLRGFGGGNNFRGTGFELVADLVEDWEDEGCDEREDEKTDSL